MPSYADSHPVPRSPFCDDSGPVHLSISGVAEDVVETSLGMDIDWETQLRTAHNSVRLEQLGWQAGDWTPAGGGGQGLTLKGSFVMLCLDSNILISHLSLLKAVQQALVSASGASPAGFAFLVPSTVLRELDGLKTSSAPADRQGAPTIGNLAQRAVAWLVDVKRMEREHGIGRGLLVGDELDMASQHALEDNDGLILAAALDTLRRSPEGTRVVLWTQDTNLQARAEFQGLPTLPTRKPPPTNPHVFLDGLGVRPSEADMLEVDMDVGPSAGPPARGTALRSTPVVTRARHQQPPSPVPFASSSPPVEHTATLAYSHLPPFEAMLVIMETHFPPAIIGRLTTFQRLARSAYDDTGLPRLEDLRKMTITLPMSFQILELIWRHQEGGWRGSALVPLQRRRLRPSLPPPLSPAASPLAPPLGESRQQSMHARRPPAPALAKPAPQTSPTARRPTDLIDADLLPPSAAHIRTHLLPALSDFCSRPFIDGMPNFLEALEAVFFGPGGRTFLGPAGWSDLAKGVERCWSHIS